VNPTPTTVLAGTQTVPYVASSSHAPYGSSVSRKSLRAAGSVSAETSYSEGLGGSAEAGGEAASLVAGAAGASAAGVSLVAGAGASAVVAWLVVGEAAPCGGGPSAQAVRLVNAEVASRPPIESSRRSLFMVLSMGPLFLLGHSNSRT
jgi:hypothetical protein